MVAQLSKLRAASNGAAGLAEHAAVTGALQRSRCRLVRLGVPTERAERRQHARSAGASSLAPGEMLQVVPETSARGDAQPRLAEAWPPASVAALAHPGLRGASGVARASGCRLAVDTSLCYDVSAAGARAAAAAQPELTTDLLRVGGYFTPGRRCVALAVDSRWHECVHELTHMAFHTRVRTAPAAAARGAIEEPLRRHWEQLRARGLSEVSCTPATCTGPAPRALRRACSARARAPGR